MSVYLAAAEHNPPQYCPLPDQCVFNRVTAAVHERRGGIGIVTKEDHRTGDCQLCR